MHTFPCSIQFLTPYLEQKKGVSIRVKILRGPKLKAADVFQTKNFNNSAPPGGGGSLTEHPPPPEGKNKLSFEGIFLRLLYKVKPIKSAKFHWIYTAVDKILQTIIWRRNPRNKIGTAVQNS